jgi:hypothetical protein
VLLVTSSLGESWPGLNTTVLPVKKAPPVLFKDLASGTCQTVQRFLKKTGSSSD